MEAVISEDAVLDEEGIAVEADGWFFQWSLGIGAPGPGVAEPNGGKDVEWCVLGAAVGDSDAPEDVLGAALRCFLDDIEIPAALEDAHIRQLELGAEASEALVFQTDVGVGVFRLRILVERLGVGVGGGGI